MNKLLWAALAMLALLQLAISQSGGGFVIDKAVIAGGGGDSSGAGPVSVTGTIGQPITGSASGGAFSIRSGFFTAFLAPTAATVQVSGRVLDPAGNPLRNVIVSLRSSSGAILVARTNSVGRFVLEEVMAGDAYLVELAARGHEFVPRILEVRDSVADLELRSIN